MKESILEDVRKLIGGEQFGDDFDTDLIAHINSSLFILSQMGIGKPDFFIVQGNETWSDFLLERQVNLRAIKSWVALKVKMMFDPPASSIIKQANDEVLKELEWRMYITENYIGEIGYYSKSEEDQKVYKSIDRVQEFLYEISYDNTDYEFANKYFKSKKPTPGGFGGCSSIRKGQLYGRNYDWTFDDKVEFVVRVAGAAHKSIGIGGCIPGLTEEFIRSGKDSELFKLIPFTVVDGINDAGLVINTNVVPKQKGKTTGTITTYDKQAELCATMLPRFVLDNFSSCQSAINYLKDYVSVYVPTDIQAMCYEVHYMIADSNSTYCIEFINNEIVATDITSKPYITNFFINGVTFNQDGKVYSPINVEDGLLPTVENGITSYGCGLERYNILVDAYSNISTAKDMQNVMKSIFYTNAYKEIDPLWYTEFVGIRNMTVDNTPEEYMDGAIPAAREQFENRSRKTGLTWHTVHSSVYDIQNKTLNLIVQEQADTKYKFVLK